MIAPNFAPQFTQLRGFIYTATGGNSIPATVFAEAVITPTAVRIEWSGTWASEEYSGTWTLRQQWRDSDGLYDYRLQLDAIPIGQIVGVITPDRFDPGWGSRGRNWIVLDVVSFIPPLLGWLGVEILPQPWR